jgi:hypothetical protein
MDTPIFEQVASSLTVKSICGQLGPKIPAGSTLADLEELLPEVDPDAQPYPVTDSEGELKGILWFEDLWHLESMEDDAPASVDELTEHIEPKSLLSSETTILDAVKLFGAKLNRFYYIVHGNDVVGVLRYHDLFRPLGRLAFLAIALEIEDLALRLCQAKSIRQCCFLSLADKRKSKAIELFGLRYEREPKLKPDGSFRDISELIECTHLVDKANMIWKQKLIAAATRADTLGFFQQLKDIRDRCAHPGGDTALISQQKLADFVASAKSMRSKLCEAMQTHGDGARDRLFVEPE